MVITRSFFCDSFVCSVEIKTPLTPFGKGEWRVGIPLEKGDTGGFFESTTSTELVTKNVTMSSPDVFCLSRLILRSENAVVRIFSFAPCVL